MYQYDKPNTGFRYYYNRKDAWAFGKVFVFGLLALYLCVINLEVINLEVTNLEAINLEALYPILDSGKLEETEEIVEETEQIIEEAEPAIEEAEPAIEETEPIIEEAEPAIEETEPIIEEAEPTIEEIEQVSEEPSPSIPAEAFFYRGHYYCAYSCDIADELEEAIAYCEALGGYTWHIDDEDESRAICGMMVERYAEGSYFICEWDGG